MTVHVYLHVNNQRWAAASEALHARDPDRVREAASHTVQEKRRLVHPAHRSDIRCTGVPAPY